MADNNALQFKIQFIEDANSINDLVKRVTERLNGTQIKLSIGDVDISKISGNLNQLEGAIKEVQTLLGKTGDAASFTGMTEGLKAATESMNTLKTALSDLNSTLSNNLGTNIGNAIVQGLAQANEAIATTMANLQKMNELASNKDLPKDINQKVNLDLAKTKIAEIDNLMVSIGKRLEASKGLGFDAGRLDEFYGKLTLIRAELSKIVDAEGAGKRVDAVLRETQIGDMKLHYNEIKTQAAGEVKAYDEVTKALRQLREEDKKLESAEGVAKLRLEIMRLYESLSGKGGNRMLQSESFNAYFKDVISRAREASKTWNEEMRLRSQASQADTREQTKAIQEQQRQQAQETSAAQKIIQREISASKQKFNELYDVLAKLREKSFFSGVDASGAMGAAQQKLTALLNQYRQMEAMLKASPQQMTAFAQSDSLKTWRQDFEAGMKIAKEGIKSITDSLKIDNLLGNLSSRFSELLRLGRNAANLGFNNLAHDAYDAAANLRQVSKELEKIQNTGLSSKGLTFNEYMRTGEFSKVISESNRAKQDVERSLRQAQQAAIKQNRTDATNEINRLKKAMQEINAIQAKSPGIKINGVEKALQDIQRIINLLEQARERGRDINLIRGVMGDYSAQNMPQVLAQLTQNQQQATVAAAQHEQAQQRMAQAIAQATGEARQQSQVLSDLRSMAAQYLSVWGATNFIKEVAQITGELELQQKSLEVIIGSASKAQELFNDIKGMSQMSPYTFQNLMKTTKQLAAFGIETKDVFSTMKMLSDIGAGLDVDVQRLVLAYGHIKSAGVLSGIQRRQLETAGVGITAELAKLYNDQYRASGSSERVTAEDVFKRIKDRQVTFEDVEKVFQRLTGPGGKFEDMQLKQYETLGGKLRNLQNNYNIMLDEIGKAHMNLLMGGVDMLNSLMENWQKWASVIKAVGAGLVAVKVAQAALGKSFMAHRAASITTAAMAREQAMIGGITAAGWGGFWPGMRGTVGWAGVNKGMLGIDYAQKINDSNMNKFQKAQAVMYKNVTRDARELLLVNQGFPPAYAANVAGLTGWRLGFERLKMSARSFFMTMRAGFASLMTNPFTWIFAAIAGITALVNAYKEMDRAAEQTTKRIREQEGSDVKSIQDTLDPIKKRLEYRRTSDGSIEFPIEISTEDAREMVEQLDAELQKFDPLYRGTLFNLEEMRDETEQAKQMILELENIKRAKQESEDRAGELATAIKDTDGVGKDSIAEELKEQEKELTKLFSAIDKAKDLESELRSTLAEGLPEGASDEVKAQYDELKKFIDYYDKVLGPSGVAFNEQLKRTVAAGGFSKNYLLYNKLDQTGLPAATEIESNYAAIRDKMKKLDNVFKSGMKNLQKEGDADGKKRARYIVEQVKNILETTESEISDPKLKEYLANYLERYVVGNFGGSEEGLKDLMDTVYPAIAEMRAGDDTAKFFERLRDTGQYNMENLSQEEIAKIVQQFNNEVVAEALTGVNQDFVPALTAAYQNALGLALKGVDPSQVDLKPWQQKIKDTLKLDKFDDVKTRLKIQVGAEADINEFIKATQESYGKCKKEAEEMARNLNIGARLGLKITPEVMFGSSKQMLLVRKKLEESLANALKEGGANGEAYKELRDMYKPLIELLDTMLDLHKISKAGNVDYTGTNHGGPNANKEKKSNPSKKSGENAADKADREEMKRIRDKIKLVQDLNRAYKQYRDLGYGELAALQKVKADYQREFPNEKNRPLDLSKITLGNVENYSKLLDEIGKQDVENNKKLKQKSKDEAKADIVRARRDILNTALRERSDRLLSDLNSELDLLSEKFSILRKVVESTGDRLEAVDMAGVGKTGEENYSDIIKEYLESELAGIRETARQLAQEREEDLKEEMGLNPEDIEKLRLNYIQLARMDEKGIENYIKETFGVDPTVDWVKGITAWAKAYRKAIRDENKAAAEAYAKAIAEDLAYEAQSQRILTAAEDEIRNIGASDASSESKARAIGIVEARTQVKLMELSEQYKRFFDGIFTEPLDDMRDFADEMKDTYGNALASGTMTAEDYAKKIAEIEDVMKKTNEEVNKGWFEKGIFNTQSQEDITKKMVDAAQDRIRQGAEMVSEGARQRDFAKMFEGARMTAEAQAELENINKRAERIRRINGIITAVDRAVQAMTKAFDYIYEAFDSLGEGEALEGIKDYMETLGTVSGHVKGAMDSFMQRDFLGMATEGVGSIMSLITGLSQAHDNRLQRKIEKIQFETEKMNDTLDTIKSLRERQLGYDNGNMRLMLAAMYSQGGNGKGDAATQAMIDFYTRYSGGSGYEQELRLLEDQRQKLLEIYNLESEKKKSSKEDLEDYKKQIADLDEQIHFFVEDLAKELWGIDLKGWADQLGDALMTAFENGTSAASAFHDTVQDIMRNMVKSMLVTSVIEPAMQNLSEKLFGKDGNGGLLNLNDPKGSMGAVLAELGNWFNNEGPKLMDAANEFYNGADNMMRQTLGYGMRENEKSSNTVDSIQSAASEETMGIVAGYLSRISQDVSVQRIMQEMFVNGSWPSYIEQVTSANDSLSAIDRSTTAMMEMMRDGNGALYERVENVSRRLDNFANGIDRIYVN